MLREYISRLLNQTTIQITGILGFAIVALFEILLPHISQRWILYLIVFITGLIIGGYRLFSEMSQEYSECSDKITDLNRKLAEIKNITPNIIVDGFKLEKPFRLVRGNKPSDVTLERYYVVFRNDKPPGKAICDTKPVHAIVSFFNTDCEILDDLSHEVPFWLGSDPPWGRPDDFNVIIKASSKPEGLCLIVRQQGGSDLFVFCDKSYIPNIRSLEPFQDSLRIPLPKFFVRIQLKSENLDMEPLWISVDFLHK